MYYPCLPNIDDFSHSLHISFGSLSMMSDSGQQLKKQMEHRMFGFKEGTSRQVPAFPSTPSPPGASILTEVIIFNQVIIPLHTS